MSKYISTCFLLVFCIHMSCGQDDSVSFLALGDSYTVGTGELKINSWPLQLVYLSRKKDTEIKLPKIIAKTGWTTSNLLKAIKTEQPKSDYGLVSLQIGVNNQYQGKDITIFKREFPLLLNKSIKLSNDNPKNVFVLSIPDWSVTPFAQFKNKKQIAKEVAIYNSIIEEETKRLGIIFIDITDISKNAAKNPLLIASDGLHPSKKMYKLWVKKIGKKLFK